MFLRRSDHTTLTIHLRFHLSCPLITTLEGHKWAPVRPTRDYNVRLTEVLFSLRQKNLPSSTLVCLEPSHTSMWANCWTAEKLSFIEMSVGVLLTSYWCTFGVLFDTWGFCLHLSNAFTSHNPREIFLGNCIFLKKRDLIDWKHFHFRRLSKKVLVVAPLCDYFEASWLI